MNSDLFAVRQFRLPGGGGFARRALMLFGASLPGPSARAAEPAPEPELVPFGACCPERTMPTGREASECKKRARCRCHSMPGASTSKKRGQIGAPLLLFTFQELFSSKKLVAMHQITDGA
ncbi:hypothetical protein Baya_11668 [Bagarius yarrelli]|uniref:Uncharacterized protein n=1 Tax=Bagarius yarrelli TaxID=175774 RepID=A0A556V118_BAGYA|nr:hypothetical protein Baya_11668 [Bagarius yarrelli]